MPKVKLVSGRCKLTITCDKVCYFPYKDKVAMYDAKGKVISRINTFDWLAISFIDDDGEEHFIKRGQNPRIRVKHQRTNTKR